MAQVRTVHQLRQAFKRVAGAVPRGAMIVVKAWLIPEIVRGVAAAREVTTGAQLPADPSRGEPVEPLWRAAAHEGHTSGKEADRRYPYWNFLCDWTVFSRRLKSLLFVPPIRLSPIGQTYGTYLHYERSYYGK